MLVTAIRPLTKQKFQVEVDEQLAFVLYKGELSRYHIEEQSELSEEDLDEIMDVVLTKRAKLYVMHLLQKRDYTEAELYRKLAAAGHPKEVSDRAVSYVKAYGYVNDEEYVRRYIMWQKEKKGKNRLIMELSQKGISRDTILRIMEEESFSDEAEQVRILLRKKKKTDGPVTLQEYRRLFGYLARKGYDPHLIHQVLQEEGTDCE